MKAIVAKLDRAYFCTRRKTANLKNKAKEAFRKEDGDTNFISILIVLAIVLVVAIVFFALKDKIVDWVKSVWDKFKTEAGSADDGTEIGPIGG